MALLRHLSHPVRLPAEAAWRRGRRSDIRPAIPCGERPGSRMRRARSLSRCNMTLAGMTIRAFGDRAAMVSARRADFWLERGNIARAVEWAKVSEAAKTAFWSARARDRSTLPSDA